MLGKAKATAGEGYQTYKGPLTAGASDIQNNLFNGIGSLTFPGNLGKSFSSTGAYQPPTYGANTYAQPGTQPREMLNQGSNGFGDFGPQPNQNSTGTYEDYAQSPTQEVKMSREQWDSKQKNLDNARQSGMDILNSGNINEILAGLGRPDQNFGSMPLQPAQQPQDIASQYMNPYLMSVLTPQLEELRRQSQITQMGNNAKLTGAGAFGGGRQAIMDAETQRNLMQEQNKTVGQGYANAYDKAMGQFNTEQGQAKTLADLMASTGATQRGIESEGVAADKAEFEKQREYPKTQLEFQQKMLSNLPIAAVTNTPGSQTDLGNLLSTLGGAGAIASAAGYKDVASLLKDLFGDT
jgi:hypothetical protein